MASSSFSLLFLLLLMLWGKGSEILSCCACLMFTFQSQLGTFLCRAMGPILQSHFVTFCQGHKLFTPKFWFIELGCQSHKLFVAEFCFKEIGKDDLILKKNCPTQASFSFIFVFTNTSYKFLQDIGVWKKSIQYTVPGFELTIFGTWVSSHNH